MRGHGGEVSGAKGWKTGGVHKEQRIHWKIMWGKARGPEERAAACREVGTTQMYNKTFVLNNDGVGLTSSEQSGDTKLKANSTKNFCGMSSPSKTTDDAKQRLIQRTPKNSTSNFYPIYKFSLFTLEKVFPFYTIYNNF